MLILHSLISSAGEEYTAVSTNVTFNASTPTQTVNIPILDNEIAVDSTMLSVALTSADPAAVLNPASADITIEDDDSEKPQIIIVHMGQHSTKLHYIISPIFSGYNWIQPSNLHCG